MKDVWSGSADLQFLWIFEYSNFLPNDDRGLILDHISLEEFLKFEKQLGTRESKRPVSFEKFFLLARLIFERFYPDFYCLLFALFTALKMYLNLNEAVWQSN